MVVSRTPVSPELLLFMAVRCRHGVENTVNEQGSAITINLRY